MNKVIARITAKQFVAAIAGKRDRYVPPGDL
jgi:hypothetical protein